MAYSDHLITDSSELSYISIGYSTLALIKERDPNILLYSSLRRLSLSLSKYEDYSNIAILAAAENLDTLALQSDGLEDDQHPECLFRFLGDKSNLPKLTSIYFSELSEWRAISSPYFLELLPALQERGVGFFAETSIEEYTEILSRNTLLQHLDLDEQKMKINMWMI